MDFVKKEKEAVITQKLITEIRGQYALHWHGLHGIGHFIRVHENGARLAAANGARLHVVELFAFLHDSRRLNDSLDPEHGARSALFARTLQGTFFHLDKADLDLLEYACRFHTDGLMEGDITVQTCWDSDRLDLGRASIKPRPSKLCTDAARAPHVIEWAYARSRRG